MARTGWLADGATMGCPLCATRGVVRSEDSDPSVQYLSCSEHGIFLVGVDHRPVAPKLLATYGLARPWEASADAPSAPTTPLAASA